MSPRCSRAILFAAFTAFPLGLISLLAQSPPIPVDQSPPIPVDQSPPIPDDRQTAGGGQVQAADTATAGLDPRHRDRLLMILAIASIADGDATSSAGKYGAIESARSRQTARAGSPARESNGAGGAAFADFDSLMQLIQTTIVPDTWEDLGGPSAMFPYQQGVFLDPRATVRRGSALPAESVAMLRELLARERRPPMDDWADANRPPNAWRSPARIRCVSLGGLMERWSQLQAAGEVPPDEMINLAGLSTVRFIWIDDGDIVLAGRVGGIDRVDGWFVDRETGRGAVRLADLSICIAAALHQQPFGCTIDPTTEGLQRAVAVGDSIRDGRLPLGRAAEALREALGSQRVEVFGTPADTTLAALMVEADRHMKRLALGKEPMPEGVKNYLNFVNTHIDLGPPDELLLRLWFTAEPMAMRTDGEGSAFELAGSAMRLSGQNERALGSGQRGQLTVDIRSDAFVDEFNQRFAEIRTKYPIYGALEGVFRAAAVAEVVQRHAAGIPSLRPLVHAFAVQASSDLAADPAPVEVDSIVASHTVRQGRKRHHLLIASGGVAIDPSQGLAGKRIHYSSIATLDDASKTRHTSSGWWWDR